MTGASVIIPTRNRLDLLQRCIESVRQYTDIPHEIIVVDNGSTDGTAAWCVRQKLALISLPRNEGFPVARNKGLRFASGEILALIASYTVVTPNWLSNMRAALGDSDVGIVGPITNNAGYLQKVRYPFEDLAEFQRIAAEVNISDRAKWIRVDRLAEFCLVFHRSLIEKIGLLEDRFQTGHDGNGDYGSRARSHGFKLLVCRDTLIYCEVDEVT